MHARFLALALTLGLITLISPCCLASQQITVHTFKQFYQQAEHTAEQYSPKDILIVFDIDDTLLKLKQPFGGASWWDWQSNLLKNNPKSPLLEAHSVQNLLKIQGMLFTLSKSQPVETNQPKLVSKLQQQGFNLLIVTARSPEFRNSTETSLIASGYHFNKTGTVHEYLSYHLNHLEKTGLTPAEVKQFHWQTPRLISYGNNILFSAGQNKGLMLKLLLKRLGLHFKSILFLDDSKTNIKAMLNAYPAKNQNVTAFYYTQMRQEKNNFKNNIPKIHQAWQIFKTSYEKNFGALLQ
ncbi:HAD superfamily, subfamily IIIB (Acid phosphatase) [Piscirickettsia salmonis]|uniref:DUF2608 domain-containing protein n=1 Tax=Piscirickettsia salmonis TaxID=1238 RepID=UPI0012BADA0D|nr:DUF2608 domain-containing protein [Piscirickettsia salmonis]QGP53754.1 HAD superfamily, subfamily IIIB (Acid phosphatase) [Piscirickettsia salmonis]QGP60336.1 HAD superfamily, subfamily IIIB (Acid phosphatase) [Piscirickettsia salmonis]QGP63338.1 HAD superfamily, subfamily IIIB (Acid phosphatase) [Piscirickettsia salmonis]